MTLDTNDKTPEPRLPRTLGQGDAVVMGLGAMIGAGVFVAIGPAARAAGNGLLLGLVLAACVAYCNATSSAALAAVYPESGGTYVYGRERLGPFWGFLAGCSFVIGKLASCAAMAMTFASYIVPAFAHELAVGAVLVVTMIDHFGVQKTASATRMLVVSVVASLAVAIVAVLLGGHTDRARLWPIAGATPYGVLQSAGILFFAFAGYARIATLGEEVVEPERTIPRAIPLALGITLLVYAAVAVSAIVGLDIEELAASPAPIAAVVEAGSMAELAPVVRAGAAIASLGVLLSLVVGVGRTVFAMARRGDLPRALAEVHPDYEVPHRAQLAVGIIVATVAAFADVRSAIGFSSFAVLVYYAIANVSAFTLPPAQRRWPRWLCLAGAVGCLAIAAALPLEAIGGGAVLLGLAAAAYAIFRRNSPTQGAV